MRVKQLLMVFVSLALLLAFTAYGLTPEEAKQELKKMNIEFSESEFLYRTKAGDTTAVSLFLDAGMNPNTRDKYGWTALMYTVWGESHAIPPNPEDKKATVIFGIGWDDSVPVEIRKRFEATRALLIQKGADINAKTDDGKSVAWIETHFGNDQKLSYIVDTADSNQYRYYELPSFRKGPDRLGALRELLALKYEYNETSFLKAVKKGDVKAVSLFLTTGMDPNVKDKYGKTALQIAQAKKHFEIVKLLKQAGAKE